MRIDFLPGNYRLIYQPLLLSLLISCIGFSILASPPGPVAHGQTQAELHVKANEEYKAADAQLNKVYKYLRNYLKDDPATWEKVQEAQRAWMKYRDLWADVAAQKYNGGSIQPMYRLSVLTDLTEEQTEHLKAMWIESYPGDEP